MEIVKITELKTEPEIGRRYLVPCLRTEKGFVPVIGEVHSDPELEITHRHFHQDVRFLTDSQLAIGNGYLSTEVSSLAVIWSGMDLPSVKPLEDSLVWKKKKCLRRMPEFPLIRQMRYLKLHEKYTGKAVKCGRYPHRNFPVENLPQDAGGNVVCSGHGLKINLREAKVVRRF